MSWKKIAKVTSLLIVLSVLNSCRVPCNIIIKKYFFTESGAVRPAKNKFKLGQNPYYLKESDHIKTDCVYQSCYRSYNSDEKIYLDCNNTNEGITFLRFFKNGRFLMTYLSPTERNLEHYNDLKIGYVGYYKIEDGILFLEYFSVNRYGMAADCGSFDQFRCEIHENSISSFSVGVTNDDESYDRKNTLTNNSYVKVKVEGLTGTPDW
ncbi:hypothetical protein [Aquimarina spinulae]|uniref:hypothetical protein n=1 Tax=Aquimarina spinulae TaxID=1192023 RepID=UPI001044C286|nr:hypothetical protein [Aquimarina spinulae]